MAEQEACIADLQGQLAEQRQVAEHQAAQIAALHEQLQMLVQRLA